MARGARINWRRLIIGMLAVGTVFALGVRFGMEPAGQWLVGRLGGDRHANLFNDATLNTLAVCGFAAGVVGTFARVLFPRRS